MSRVLIIAQTELDNETSGVWKKVKNQALALQKLFGDVVLVGYKGKSIISRFYEGDSNKDIILSRIGIVPRKLILWYSVSKFIQDKRFDYAFIRYPVIDVQVLKVFSILNKKGTKIVMEVPTYPLETQHAKGGLKLAYIVDKYLHNYCSNYLKKIVYIGNNVGTIFGCIAQQIPNGISAITNEDVITGFSLTNKVIRMVAVSTMRIWHGYDRLIDGLGNYYSNETINKYKYDIELILVGDGPYRELYEELVNKNKLNARVKFVGELGDEGLKEVYSKATIGIGSLGLYRNNMYIGSTLKTREYLLHGLPFVYGCEEIGLPTDYPYGHLVSNNADPIDISKIVDFIIPLLEDNKRISIQMHEYALENFSWEKIMNSIFINV